MLVSLTERLSGISPPAIARRASEACASIAFNCGYARRNNSVAISPGEQSIDEIGDLPALLQPKLLRAIDRNEVRPLGSTQAIKADVRIIAATRRDLDREVQEGRFRDDLFHRLAVGRIEYRGISRSANSPSCRMATTTMTRTLMRG